MAPTASGHLNGASDSSGRWLRCSTFTKIDQKYQPEQVSTLPEHVSTLPEHASTLPEHVSTKVPKYYAIVTGRGRGLGVLMQRRNPAYK